MTIRILLSFSLILRQKCFLINTLESSGSIFNALNNDIIDRLINLEFIVKYLPSATKLRRLCFYRRLSVHEGGWVCLSQCMLGYHTPQSRHPPPQSRHPPGSRHPQEQTPPQSRHPPQERRPLLQTVRILLECILVIDLIEISFRSNIFTS